MKTYILLKEVYSSPKYYPYNYSLFFIHSDGITGKTVRVACMETKTNEELIRYYNHGKVIETEFLDDIRYKWKQGIDSGFKRIL
jgi:hypothetical protein